MLVTGEAQEDWWIANIVPLFMDGRRDSPRANRPVSLALMVGKL